MKKYFVSELPSRFPCEEVFISTDLNDGLFTSMTREENIRVLVPEAEVMKEIEDWKRKVESLQDILKVERDMKDAYLDRLIELGDVESEEDAKPCNVQADSELVAISGKYFQEDN